MLPQEREMRLEINNLRDKVLNLEKQVSELKSSLRDVYQNVKIMIDKEITELEEHLNNV